MAYKPPRVDISPSVDVSPPPAGATTPGAWQGQGVDLLLPKKDPAPGPG